MKKIILINCYFGNFPWYFSFFIKSCETNPSVNFIIFSDSKYVIDSVDKKWVFGWLKTGFKGKKNKDLWLQFLNVYKLHSVKFVWVKGHNNHPENERCDELAVAASKNKAAQMIDAEFEAEKNKATLL